MNPDAENILTVKQPLDPYLFYAPKVLQDAEWDDLNDVAYTARKIPGLEKKGYRALTDVFENRPDQIKCLKRIIWDMVCGRRKYELCWDTYKGRRGIALYQIPPTPIDSWT